MLELPRELLARAELPLRLLEPPPSALLLLLALAEPPRLPPRSPPPADELRLPPELRSFDTRLLSTHLTLIRAPAGLSLCSQRSLDFDVHLLAVRRPMPLELCRHTCSQWTGPNREFRHGAEGCVAICCRQIRQPIYSITRLPPLMLLRFPPLILALRLKLLLLLMVTLLLPPQPQP